MTVGCSGMALGGGILLGLYLGKGDYGTARRLGQLLCRGSLLTGALAGLILAAIRCAAAFRRARPTGSPRR